MHEYLAGRGHGGRKEKPTDYSPLPCVCEEPGERDPLPLSPPLTSPSSLWSLKVWVGAGVVTLANDWGGRDSWRVTLAGFLPLIVHETRLTTHTSERCLPDGEAATLSPARPGRGQRCPSPPSPRNTLPSCRRPLPAVRPDTLPQPPHLFIKTKHSLHDNSRKITRRG